MVEFIRHFVARLGKLTVFRWIEIWDIQLKFSVPTQFSIENVSLARVFIFRIRANFVSLQIILLINFHLYLLPPLEQYETLQSSYLLPSFQTRLTADNS